MKQKVSKHCQKNERAGLDSKNTLPTAESRTTHRTDEEFPSQHRRETRTARGRSRNRAAARHQWPRTHRSRHLEVVRMGGKVERDEMHVCHTYVRHNLRDVGKGSRATDAPVERRDGPTTKTGAKT